MFITKAEFAKLCGVSKPTLYKWIEKNKGNIKDFVTDDGILAAALDKEPFNQYKARTDADKRQTVGGKMEELEKENAALKTQLETLKDDNAKLAAQLAAKENEIARLEQNCNDLRTQAEFLRTLTDNVIKQPPALPERKSPFAWLNPATWFKTKNPGQD